MMKIAVFYSNIFVYFHQIICFILILIMQIVLKKTHPGMKLGKQHIMTCFVSKVKI